MTRKERELLDRMIADAEGQRDAAHGPALDWRSTLEERQRHFSLCAEVGALKRVRRALTGT